MSSCLSGGRTFSIDLDIANPSSPSSGGSSSPSSTLSESSNSPRTISFKKARSPRKRPNQNYNEAAALLSTIYPTVFFAKNPEKLPKTATLASFPEFSALLPPLPVLSDDAFLIRKPLQESQCDNADCELKHEAPVDREGESPVSNVFWELTLPDPLDGDLDAESILEEEVEEDIDSIMGNLRRKNSTNGGNIDSIKPLFQCLIESPAGQKFDLELGTRWNLKGALRKRGEGDWWRSLTVVIQDINRDCNPSTVSASWTNNNKKKVDKEEAEGVNTASNSTSTPPQELKAGLGLKLSHKEVLNEWSNRGSMFADGPDWPNSSADVLAKLAEIDLFPDCGSGGGGREARVLRYKEKRRSRLFSKKIRYEVRKVNAEQRPRMKARGRFVRRPSLIPSPGRAPREKHS